MIFFLNIKYSKLKTINTITRSKTALLNTDVEPTNISQIIENSSNLINLRNTLTVLYFFLYHNKIKTTKIHYERHI